MALKKKMPLIFVIVLILSILTFSYWWICLRNRVVTEDAYVKSDSSIVSSRVKGSVVKVFVDNDDFVKKGDLLVLLDEKDYRVEVEGRRATLKRIDAQIEELKKTIQLTKKEVEANISAALSAYEAAKAKEREAGEGIKEVEAAKEAAKTNFLTVKRDFKRYENLYREGAISKQKRDHAEDLYKKAKAKLDSVNAKLKATKALFLSAKKNVQRTYSLVKLAKANRMKVDVLKKKIETLRAAKKESESLLNGALLRLSYCRIYAPISGYISQKSVEVGEKIAPGQPLMAVVPLNEVYVEANFKETELKDIRIGQKATIVADIYPNHKFFGHVVGIRAGTGAAFSLLPPENATGNWIKVVQRVPVKIYFDSTPSKKFPLRVGLSVKVSIDVSNKKGKQLR